MATEGSKLLGKSSGKTFNYLSTASISVAPKLKECIVVLPQISKTSNDTDGSIGLTYEELYVYLDEPRWKLFRRCAWMSFWFLLIAIFTSSCIISIIESKRCTVYNTKSTLNNIVSSLTNDIVSKNNFTT